MEDSKIYERLCKTLEDEINRIKLHLGMIQEWESVILKLDCILCKVDDEYVLCKGERWEVEQEGLLCSSGWSGEKRWQLHPFSKSDIKNGKLLYYLYGMLESSNRNY